MQIIKGVGEGKEDFENLRLPSLSFYRETWINDLVNKYGYEEDFARNWVYHRNEV